MLGSTEKGRCLFFFPPTLPSSLSASRPGHAVEDRSGDEKKPFAGDGKRETAGSSFHCLG